MAAQVPATPVPNQVEDVVNVTPAPAIPTLKPVIAAPIVQVENWPPAVINNVAQNAALEVTIPNC